MKKLILLIATGGGVGYLLKIPGTAGSVVGLVLFYLLKNFSPHLYFITLLALFFLSVWASSVAETFFAQKDSQKIVIDEVIGMMVTLSFLPLSWKSVFLGFVLFRLFDIWKPFPVRLCQDKLPGGWGVVGDDVMAGIYANMALQILLRFL